MQCRRRVPDPERRTGLGGRITGTHQRHQARRIDECQPPGLDRDGSRARPEHFADSSLEQVDASYVELTDKDDGGFGTVVLGLDV